MGEQTLVIVMNICERHGWCARLRPDRWGAMEKMFDFGIGECVRPRARARCMQTVRGARTGSAYAADLAPCTKKKPTKKRTAVELISGHDVHTRYGLFSAILQLTNMFVDSNSSFFMLFYIKVSSSSSTPLQMRTPRKEFPTNLFSNFDRDRRLVFAGSPALHQIKR